MNLYDAVQQRKKQKKTDSKQDDELQALRSRVEKAEKRVEENERNPRRDDYGHNFQQASALIQRQYDEGYGRLGSRFAMGDSTSLPPLPSIPPPPTSPHLPSTHPTPTANPPQQ